MAAHGDQARGLRAPPPARAPLAGERRRRASPTPARPPAPPTTRPSAGSGCTTAPRRSAGSSHRSCARCCSRPRGTPTSEICELTGWTYTKVNRCLTEGRRAFSERLDGDPGRRECERLAGRLSALADGEASAADIALLRPHLRTCLACRTRLREYRTTPARVAALAPPLALAAGHGGGLRGCSSRSWARPSTRRPRSASAPTPRPSWPPARRSPRWPHRPRPWRAAAPRSNTSRPRITGRRRCRRRCVRWPRRSRRPRRPWPSPRRSRPRPSRPSRSPRPTEPPAPPKPEPAQEFDPVAAQAAAAPAAAPAPADAAFAPGGSAQSGGGAGGSSPRELAR